MCVCDRERAIKSVCVTVCERGKEITTHLHSVTFLCFVVLLQARQQSARIVFLIFDTAQTLG